MARFETMSVTELRSERQGLQRVMVQSESGATAHAFVLTGLTGPVAVGDRVVVNTTAVDLGLGTGGSHIVHWNLERDHWEQPGPGHIMKMRYTSLQFDSGAAEEIHTDLPQDLERVPVIACGLHSQVGVVAATLAHLRPGSRVAYVMTDGAALPLVMSDLVEALCQRGLLAGTVTAGHAFGGDLEAVSIPSALVLARAVQRADAVIVGMGPGVVGTGSRLGTTAVEVASVLDSTAALGGEPVICVRASSGDRRGRHQGVSHHTLTALDLTRVEPHIGVPRQAPYLDTLVGRSGLAIVEVPDVGELLSRFDLTITTMGRGPHEDTDFFDAAAAAAAVAASLIEPRSTRL